MNLARPSGERTEAENLVMHRVGDLAIAAQTELFSRLDALGRELSVEAGDLAAALGLTMSDDVSDAYLAWARGEEPW